MAGFRYDAAEQDRSALNSNRHNTLKYNNKMENKANLSSLIIKPKMQYITVLHDIVFALEAQLAGIFRALLTA